MACPADAAQALGIRLPVLVLVLKPDRLRHCSFEVQLLDDTGALRRLRASSYQLSARVTPHIGCLPLVLPEAAWCRVTVNLASLVRRAYGTGFVEVTRLLVHASCHVRRIYFADRAYADEQLPPEFRLYAPIQRAP